MDGLIQFLIIVVFVLISAAWQFFTERPPQRQRGRGQRGAPQKKPPKRRTLESEIEDFLRDVTGQPPKDRGQPKQGRRGDQQRLNRPREPELIAAEPIVLEPEIIDESGGIGTESVADHVRSHISSSLSTQESHLGESIENRDEAMSEHLNSVFDHDVGSLRHQDDGGTGEKKRRVDDDIEELSAADVREMFESPDGIRTAVILSEILTPKYRE